MFVCIICENNLVIFVIRLLSLLYILFCLAMRLIYSLVAREKVVLVEYTSHSGDFADYAQKVP